VVFVEVIGRFANGVCLERPYEENIPDFHHSTQFSRLVRIVM
jgi:hypothetical protein